MSVPQTLLQLFGGVVGLAALATAIAKLLVSQGLKRELQRHNAKLDRDLAEHKIRLQAQHDTALEVARHELTLRAHEHQVAFTRLHEKRAAVIAGVYARLQRLSRAVESFVNTGNTEPDRGPSWQRGLDAYLDLSRYFYERRIWLDPETCDAVNHILALLYKPLGTLMVIQERNRKDFESSWHEAQRILDDSVPRAQQILDQRLRAILRVVELNTSEAARP